jgi:hypothetical protein
MTKDDEEIFFNYQINNNKKNKNSAKVIKIKQNV